MDNTPPLPDSESLDKDYATDGPVSNTPDPQKPESRPANHTRAIVIGSVFLILIIILGVVSVLLAKKPDQKVVTTPVTINTQSLDNGTLNKLAQAGPGQTKQQLTISPDTLFKSSIAVDGSLQTSKNIDVGGTLNVKSTTTLQSAVAINSNLAVRGALSVGGTLSAAALNVGALGTTTLNASGNLNFGGHLVPSGGTPSTKTSVATSSGTVVISGNDTAGTVTITIGNAGPLTAGEMAIIGFSTAFATTPKVQLTAVNAASANLDYYVSRSATFFTINTANTPATGGSYVFDYLVTQ